MLRQLAVALVGADHVQRHDGRQLAVERQAGAQVQQFEQVRLGQVGHLVRVRLLGVAVDVREGRAAGHEGVAVGRRLGLLVGAHAHVLQVRHAWALEPVGGRERGGSARVLGCWVCGFSRVARRAGD